MRRHVLLAAALVLMLGAWDYAAGGGDDFKCGPIDCDVMKDHPEKRFNAPFTTEAEGKPGQLDNIDELRQKFWDTYPDKKGHAEAREAFAQALFYKDMFNLQWYLFGSVGNPKPSAVQRGEDIPAKLAEAMGLLVDGGIPPTARPEFVEWAEAARAALGEAKTTDEYARGGWVAGAGLLSPTFRKVWNPAGKEYQAYVMERDWAEFNRKGVVPAGFNDREHYAIFLYFRYGKLSYAQSVATYEGMKKALSPKVVEGAADWVRAQPKKENGDLVVTLPEPVKKGPSGALVDDYDAAYPEDITGVYRDPKMAFEAAATKDDAKRYLLLQLANRYYEGRSFLPSTADKWTYAMNAYGGIVKAFGGEDKVLAVAESVRKAKKRVISGSIIGEKELGATRQMPLETFEDIICRKYPEGHLKAAIAFGEDFEYPGKVDVPGEYKKITTEKGETAWLEASKRSAAAKPNLLVKWELDVIRKELEQPTVAKVAGPMVDYPEYLAWKGFAPGAKVTLVQRIWYQQVQGGDKLVARHPDDRMTYLLKSVDAERADLWRTEQVFDPNGAAHPTRDTEIAFPAKIEADTSGRTATAHKAMGVVEDNVAWPQAALLAMSRPERGFDPTPGNKDTGDEDVEVGGRKIKAHWRSVTYKFTDQSYYKGGTISIKVWTSDEVPGKLVRKVEDLVVPPNPADPRMMQPMRTVTETYVEAIAGFSPGTAAETKGVEWAPEEVALGGKKILGPGDLPVPVVKAEPLPPQNGRGQVTRAPDTPLVTRPPVVRDPAVIRARVQLMREYSPLMVREGQAKGGVMRAQRMGTVAPEDVKTANAALDEDMKALNAAFQGSERAEVEKAAKALEEHVVVVEQWLKGQGALGNGR